MTTRESSSPPVGEGSSTMGDTITSTEPNSLISKNNNHRRNGESRRKRNNNHSQGAGGGGEEEGDMDEECEVEAWDTLSRSFRQAQSVLDQNRNLIQQVNANHQSKIPDNLSRNVSLIRQINGNISKVISIYSDLSANFSTIVHERRRSRDGGSGAAAGGQNS